MYVQDDVSADVLGCLPTLSRCCESDCIVRMEFPYSASVLGGDSGMCAQRSPDWISPRTWI